MPIKLKCPNDSCGKVLEMPVEFAGKKGKCPSCGAMFMIPKPAARGDVAVGRVVEDRPSAAPSGAAGSLPRAERAFADAGEGFDRPRKKKFRSRSSSDTTSLAMGGVGIALLVLLALTPIMPWIYASGSVTRNGVVERQNSDHPSGWKLSSDGKVLFGVSLGVAGLAGLCLLLAGLSTMPREASDLVFGLGMAATAAWGMIAALWHVGWVWRVFSISSEISDAIQPMADLARTANVKFSVGFYPHIGLVLGLLTAISIATVLSLAAQRRMRPEFLMIALGVGLLTGILILVLHIEPWTATRGFGMPSIPSVPRGPALRVLIPGCSAETQTTRHREAVRQVADQSTSWWRSST